ncbi:winged helix-turn-helix transcriptional regulator [Parasporobacterium paucivorans]|uniref:Transcriptional regulator, HxlR family n=1 Tax=Parasporobacterium paucivorans DSM 15970 TaxID=1122934 RepID=A0A1M6LQR7_9FIRM|nr:helix-turn-helix domain-containing protein [Parasporobacterium paucivorans]SHJ73412.1 transcriptional regulator, HxlR family [Parasporobacterium paucivorans DSM 15970]
MAKNETYTCPVDAAISIVGGKYKVVILYHLTAGTLRFNELQKLIPNATPKMLTQQLRELEGSGLISRTVYPVVPPKTEYNLTDFGKTLMPVLEALCKWGKTYIFDDKK